MKKWILYDCISFLLLQHIQIYNSQSSRNKLECKVNNTTNFYLIKQFNVLQQQYKIVLCNKEKKIVIANKTGLPK